MSGSGSQDTGQFWFVLGELWSCYAAEMLPEQVPEWQGLGLDPRIYEL